MGCRTESKLGMEKVRFASYGHLTIDWLIVSDQIGRIVEEHLSQSYHQTLLIPFGRMSGFCNVESNAACDCLAKF